MIVTSWQKKEIEAQRGEAMAEAPGEAGAEPGCGGRCVWGLPPTLGLLNRAEGGRHFLRCAQLKMWTPEM